MIIVEEKKKVKVPISARVSLQTKELICLTQEAVNGMLETNMLKERLTFTDTLEHLVDFICQDSLELLRIHNNNFTPKQIIESYVEQVVKDGEILFSKPQDIVKFMDENLYDCLCKSIFALNCNCDEKQALVYNRPEGVDKEKINECLYKAFQYLMEMCDKYSGTESNEFEYYDEMREEFEKRMFSQFKITNLVNCYKTFYNWDIYEKLDGFISKVQRMLKIYIYKQAKLGYTDAYQGEFEKFMEGHYDTDVRLTC